MEVHVAKDFKNLWCFFVFFFFWNVCIKKIMSRTKSMFLFTYLRKKHRNGNNKWSIGGARYTLMLGPSIENPKNHGSSLQKNVDCNREIKNKFYYFKHIKHNRSIYIDHGNIKRWCISNIDNKQCPPYFAESETYVPLTHMCSNMSLLAVGQGLPSSPDRKYEDGDFI